MALDNRSNTKINEFKLLISNSYRNYNYDLKIQSPSNVSSLDTDEYMAKYLFENNVNISLLCKSIGDLEADIEDIKVETQGREHTTGGKFRYKMPITMSFYDVILNNGETNPIFLSDVFNYWIDRWNYEHPTQQNEKLYTRRRYRDDNVCNLNVSVYSGIRIGASNGQDIEDLTSKTNEIKTLNSTQITQMKKLLEASTAATNFDRWKFFWKNILDEDNGFAFSRALNGFGGSSITLHGMINGFVFTILKGLQIGEMFYNLSEEIKDNKFQESGADYAKKSAIALTGSQYYMEKPAMEVDDIIKDNPDDDQLPLDRNMFNEAEFQNELSALINSNSLNSKLMDQLINVRKTPEFNKFKEEMTSVIDKYKFENDIQKDTLKQILNFLGGEESNIKQLGDSVDLIGNFITQEGLEDYKNKIQNIIDTKGSDFVNSDSINMLIEVVGNINQLITSGQLDDPLYNEEFKSIIQDTIAILDNLNLDDSFIEVEGLKHYLSKTNFSRDAVGWHIKSRNVITGLFAPASLFVRILQAKDNLKSTYNLIGVANGWDDFINTVGLPESVIMRSGLTIQEFIKGSFDFSIDNIADMDLLNTNSNALTENSTNQKSEFNTELLPGEAYSDNLKGSYLEKVDRPVESGDYVKDHPATKYLRKITLTKAYPTSVKVQPALSNDSTGLESIPVIDITFNFYDIKSGE